MSCHNLVIYCRIYSSIISIILYIKTDLHIGHLLCYRVWVFVQNTEPDGKHVMPMKFFQYLSRQNHNISYLSPFGTFDKNNTNSFIFHQQFASPRTEYKAILIYTPMTVINQVMWGQHSFTTATSLALGSVYFVQFSQLSLSP